MTSGSSAVAASSGAPIAIFDFDGTIVDSLDVMIHEYNRVAPRYRIKPIDRADLSRLRTLKPQAALKEHGVSFWKLPFLVRTMRAAMREHVDSVPAIEGVLPALRSLSTAGVRCSVLSTNSSENIQRFLTRHGLVHFEHVAGGSSMFGKAAALKKLIQRAGFDPGAVLYVGDEVRDISAAKAAGVRSIGVSWGYADRAALLAQAPDHLLDRPSELIDLLAPRRVV